MVGVVLLLAVGFAAARCVNTVHIVRHNVSVWLKHPPYASSPIIPHSNVHDSYKYPVARLFPNNDGSY